MPSPDAVNYVGLPLLEVDAQELLDRALANAAVSFPDWTPREGNTEVVLLEEFAAMAEEIVYVLNDLPNGLTEILLRLFGLDRDQGTPPQVEVQFTVVDDTGYTIDEGTVVRLDLGDETEPIDFTTEVDLVIPVGATVGTVLASASEPTTLANGLGTSTPVELLDAITYVESVALASPVAGGRIAEDGLEFLNRAAPLLRRLTNTLVRPTDIELYVAENADVTRVKVLDLYNHANPSIPPGNAPGYVTVAVAGPAGSQVPAGVRSFLVADLRNRMHAGLSVSVVNADLNVVDVSVKVLAFPLADPAEVEANVIAAVRAYLDPDRWPWERTIRVNELIARVDAAVGVNVVLDIVTPRGDTYLTGYAPLVKAGAVTVEVVTP